MFEARLRGFHRVSWLISSGRIGKSGVAALFATDTFMVDDDGRNSSSQKNMGPYLHGSSCIRA
jgi:hypothetical protein